MSDPRLIEWAIELAGVSLRVFAERITWRDERTVRRWKSGQIPIPGTAKRKLLQFVGCTDAQRKAWVAAALAEAS